MMITEMNLVALNALIMAIAKHMGVPRERWEAVKNWVYNSYAIGLNQPYPERIKADCPIVAFDRDGANRYVHGPHIELLDWVFAEIVFRACREIDNRSEVLTPSNIASIIYDLEGTCDSSGYDIIIRHSRCRKRFNCDHEDLFGAAADRRRRFIDEFAQWCSEQ